ncbi:hypothetical protein G6F60_013537 [Rhizopus arrhizus]|nr:hypothetical protein G6F60_013537 [Rhizopus arrhizus]
MRPPSLRTTPHASKAPTDSAGRRPGIGAAGQHQLHQHDGQHQRDDRREEWRRPPIERQPPRHQRKQRRGTHCRQCGQRSGTRRKPIMREGQAGGIGAHAKKGRLAERQMAGVAPQHIHRHRRHRKKQRLDQHVEQVGVEQPGAGHGKGEARGCQPRQSLAARRARGRHGGRLRVLGKRMRGQYGDGDAAQDRADENAHQHLASAIDQAGQEQCSDRMARHHDQHEGADQPRQAHVRIDAG